MSAETGPLGRPGTTPTNTRIGVDVGANQLVVAMAAGADPSDAIVVDGQPARDVYSAFQRATHRLHAGELADVTIEELAETYRPLAEERFRAAAARVLQYARAFASPVLVLEDLHHDAPPLRATEAGELRFGTWATGTIHRTLLEAARAANIPVELVDPEGTSQECHRCGTVGELDRHTLTCTTSSCAVETVDRDRSAALSIAQRGRGQPDQSIGRRTGMVVADD